MLTNKLSNCQHSKVFLTNLADFDAPTMIELKLVFQKHTGVVVTCGDWKFDSHVFRSDIYKCKLSRAGLRSFKEEYSSRRVFVDTSSFRNKFLKSRNVMEQEICNVLFTTVNFFLKETKKQFLPKYIFKIIYNSTGWRTAVPLFTNNYSKGEK